MEELHVKLPEGRIEYLKHGSGPPLLFLHGGFATPRAYIPLIEFIGRTHTVIAPTHPGHGNSFDVDKTWTIQKIATVYQNFLNELKFAPKIIVGHSIGGTIGLLLSRKLSLDRIIVFDSPGLPFIVDAAGAKEKRWLETKLVTNYLKNREGMKVVLSVLGSVLFTAYKHRENIPWLFEHVPTLDLEEQFKQVRVPTSIFWGSIDGMVPPKVGMALHKCITGSSLVILQEKGHGYPLMDPQFTYEQIQDLI